MIVVMAAAAVILIVMMVVVLVLLVVVIMAAAVVILIVMMVVVFVLFLFFQPLGFHPGQLGGQRCLAFHGLHQLLAGQLTPGSCDDGGHLVALPQHLNRGIQLRLGNGIGTGQDDGRGGLHLIVVELPEVFGVNLYLTGIHHSHGVAQGYIGTGNLVHGADHIGQLAHAGGLNDNPVGMVLPDDLFQGFSEVTHQGAADTAGVHLGNVDARILQEAAVDSDFSEFILNQYQLLALVALGDHLLDQRGLTGTQKTGININLCHHYTFHKNNRELH